MKTREYVTTLMAPAIVLAMAAQKGNGFLLALLLPLFLLVALYQFIRMFQRPGERKRRGVRLVIWSLALGLAGAVQAYWSAASRNDAEQAVGKVIAHKERTGAYPASLGDVGVDERHLNEQWEIRYVVRDGKPVLAYPATIMPLTMHEYDFAANKWWQNAY